LVEVVNGLLKRAVGPTQMMVSNLVKIELAYINTSHPDFIGGSRAVAQLMRKLEKEKDTASKTTGVTVPLSSISLNLYTSNHQRAITENMQTATNVDGHTNFICPMKLTGLNSSARASRVHYTGGLNAKRMR
jgi:hypothetical protein